MTLQDALVFVGGGCCREHEQLRALAAECGDIELGNMPFATLAHDLADDQRLSRFCEGLHQYWRRAGGLRSASFFRRAAMYKASNFREFIKLQQDIFYDA